MFNGKMTIIAGEITLWFWHSQFAMVYIDGPFIEIDSIFPAS